VSPFEGDAKAGTDRPHLASQKIIFVGVDRLGIAVLG